MSNPNLYKYKDKNNYFCAHDFAQENSMSIRKARRILSQMVKRGELQFLVQPRLFDQLEDDIKKERRDI